MTTDCEGGCAHEAHESVFSLMAEASNATSMGDYEVAREAYRRAIEALVRKGEPTGGMKLLLLDLLDRMEDDEAVLALADELDASAERSAAINIARTNAYLRMGSHDQAIAAGRTAIADLERDGGFVQGPVTFPPFEAWYRYALALRFGGEPAASIEPFGRAIELDAMRPRAHFDLAVALSAIGDREGAVRSVERAIEIDPLDNDAHYNLGCYRALLGDRDRALAALARAVELDAANAELARDDDDYASLRGEAAFTALIAPR